MIHDITINSDFTKDKERHFSIDIFGYHKNNFIERFLDKCNRYDRKNGNDFFESEKEKNEIILTGTALKRRHKQYYLKDINNCCYCCGNDIEIKLWDLKLNLNDGNLTLCRECNTRLTNKYNDLPTIVIKPWNNLDITIENIKYKAEHERRIKDLFLWD